MKIIYCLLILTVLYSCSRPEYKICEFDTKNYELKLYHDILTELIEQHFYNGYLKQVVTEELEDKYPATIDPADTVDFQKDLILLQNKIFNDTAKFETICFAQSLVYGPWTYNRNDTTVRTTLLKSLTEDFSSNWKSISDTISTAQTRYTAQDFKLCTSKVISCGHFYESDIGSVSFSKVILSDDRTKGLLYYEFTCGGKCGKGEIILVELINQRWTIKKINQIWIS